MSSNPAELRGWRALLSWRWSIAGRLTRHFFFATALLLALSAAYLYVGLRRSLEQQDRALVASKVKVLRALLRESGDRTEALRSEIEHEAGEVTSLHYYLRVLDADGAVLVETPGMSSILPPTVFPEAKAGVDIVVSREQPGGGFLIGTSRASAGADAPVLRVLQVALDTSHNEQILATYRVNLAWMFFIGSALAVGLGVVIARAGLRPLSRIAETIQRITATRLHERVSATRWPGELTSLAHEFDGMLDRLEDSFRRLNQFTGDMAHALRNPINNLRGEAEVMLSRPRGPEEYQQALASSLEEYERLSRMIEGLLFVARADEAATAIETRSFEVRAEMEAVREFYDALAAEKGVTVTCEGDAPLVADSMLVRRAISNLLANALKHTPAGGSIVLAARRSDDGSVQVSVSDTGVGIAAAHLPRVFERFFQVDKTRDHPAKGAGLGLAIVQSIMRLHRGTAEIESAVGRGTRVTLRFPVVPTAN